MIRRQHLGRVRRNKQWNTSDGRIVRERSTGEDAVKPSIEQVGSWWRIRNALIVIGDVVGVLVLIGVIAVLGSHGFNLDLFTG